uniref:t-SNARE coiled-coil homology domain-containing protein n=1 Tax=Compsopogon caeruleus TaxID=31354 RepID=A0A7S1T854_9RHOD|mmetsp:Transcript_12703/g.25778  ORF Transcript_12703/g.25778 Transcript_12703/m.25778 type:complete len:322 (+) Transcript_12703:300-1265(+)|eukprot:CAMPEP_0184690842 /NCGR_PEP_ID=MMETSP0312-20130426/31464_1 /TAXON_ID=31354 /ORGANISM="Compsopogon coeruleus, Strain SAG 36.94" /LENGTH=321 /DNA_ID=CAMNT_0027148405 /DNA_START=1368 /DNA_END=2333 /DNA_ORIENTATION=-
MAPRMGGTSRDRTKEFFDVVRSVEASKLGASVSAPEAGSLRARRSQFNLRAAAIGKDIQSVSVKLEKLAKLAQRKSLFDDPTVEIQELTFVIKQDIAGLNSKLEELGKLQAQAGRAGSKQAGDHLGNVVDALKNHLAHTASDFKDVLKLRTESLQAQQSRRSQFLGDSSSLGPLGSSVTRSSASSVAIDLGSGSAGAVATDSLVSQSQEDSSSRGPAEFRMQLQQARPESAYLRARAEAVQQVESTIAELGQIFSQLATMVSQQGEMVERIDANVEDTLRNMEEGQNQLVQYYNSVSSNRGLILKVFGVFLLFLILWIFLA